MATEQESVNKILLKLSSECSEVLRRRLAMAGELYRVELTPLQVFGFVEALEDINNPEIIDAAFAGAFRNCKFLPTPAEIREEARYAHLERENRAKLEEPKMGEAERKRIAEQVRKNPKLAILFEKAK